ncbi:MAG: hypothetical protein VB078_02410 [Clostridiaceae bacterium]|nr:hypothetical protein [Clostridiaceae bacterium]
MSRKVINVSICILIEVILILSFFFPYWNKAALALFAVLLVAVGLSQIKGSEKSPPPLWLRLAGLAFALLLLLFSGRSYVAKGLCLCLPPLLLYFDART